MTKKQSVRKKPKTLEEQHAELFYPYREPAKEPAPVATAGQQNYVVVTVATYGGYGPPIEGWSTAYAELGGSSPRDS